MIIFIIMELSQNLSQIEKDIDRMDNREMVLRFLHIKIL